MTSAERPVDYNGTVNEFLKLYEQELELQAVKLTKFYGIDFHELLSRTAGTVWEKWPGELCMLPHKEGYKYALHTMYNHARNLSKGARRHWSVCEPLVGDERERSAYTATASRDPAVEAIFRDDRLAIYRAISQLDGRCREVMVLVALGLENSEIRQELDLTVTNLTSILARARESLREILGLGDGCEGGESP